MCSIRDHTAALGVPANTSVQGMQRVCAAEGPLLDRWWSQVAGKPAVSQPDLLSTVFKTIGSDRVWIGGRNTAGLSTATSWFWVDGESESQSGRRLGGGPTHTEPPWAEHWQL